MQIPETNEELIIKPEVYLGILMHIACIRSGYIQFTQSCAVLNALSSAIRLGKCHNFGACKELQFMLKKEIQGKLNQFRDTGLHYSEVRQPKFITKLTVCSMSSP
jgi:hypothetical protein